MLRLKSFIFGHICTPLINGILLDLNQMWTIVDIFSGWSSKPVRIESHYPNINVLALVGFRLVC